MSFDKRRLKYPVVLGLSPPRMHLVEGDSVYLKWSGTDLVVTDVHKFDGKNHLGVLSEIHFPQDAADYAGLPQVGSKVQFVEENIFAIQPLAGKINVRPLLPPQARKILKLLFDLKPIPQSIWLFGSRANGRATSMSDTDLLVFASSAFVESLCRATAQPQDVDILVVVDGDTIIYPWRQETASLKSWQWRPYEDCAASYEGAKWIPDTTIDESEFLEFGQLVKLHERAIRLSLADA